MVLDVSGVAGVSSRCRVSGFRVGVLVFQGVSVIRVAFRVSKAVVPGPQ